ncbi:ABC transporter ATP-binding protein [uncultured Clostridium sp.]|uniref:ABC transporter ATP-binding protein n=1 Tax=uncultured Clostridium sp. TaxID=59620 RepID=UPI002631C0F9|nr:ABC transporter ATP-binding protein [uncultured Clostridium sp.]
MDRKILEVKNLKKYFTLDKKTIIKAVDDISFELYEGEVLGIVGESGSGKSTLGRSIIKIHDVTEGNVYFNGVEVTDNRMYKKNKDYITREMQVIFQDSTSCLNQRRNILSIISEPLRIKKFCKNKEELFKRVLEISKAVGLSEEDLYKYPSEISGGQRQRVSVARALTLKPKLIIADEPIASLDVSMQAQIVNLLKHLTKAHNVACIFIAHDLSMVRYISDRIAVMYKGKIVEIGCSEAVYNNPIHPYTKILISSRLTANPRFKNLNIVSAYDEEDKEFNFKTSRLIKVSENHSVYKSI